MAFARSKVKIFMVPADTDPATIVDDTSVIAGEIVNYSKSGGNQDTESVPAFGGFIDKEKPREQVEVSMEVVPSLSDATAAVRWEAMSYSADTTNAGIYTLAAGSGSAVPPTPQMIVIQALEGAVYQTYAFNNVDVTQYDLDHAADDNRTGNITFKFSPTTEDGVSNLMVGAVAVSALPDWTDLDL